MKKHRLRRRLLVSGLALSGMWTALPAAAHGAPDFPISRQYNCYQNRAQPACVAAIADGGEQAIYDWNGVNQGAAAGNHRAVVADGALCAGGQTKFKGFDLARNDWQTTTWSPGADGKFEFRYNATAPHRSAQWQFYLTRDGWNPAAGPLKWADLDLVSTLGPSEIDTSVPKRYTMKLRLPQRSGHHVLYAIWQRSDSGEAFYSCSDVSFGGASANPGGNPTAPVTPSTLVPLGQVVAQQDLPAQSRVVLRVFSEQGSDLEAITLGITGQNGARMQWLAQLAAQANGNSAYVRMGDAQGNNVTVPASATAMQIYALPGKGRVNYAVDIALPAKPVDPAAPATGGWAEGASYKVGQVVSHNGANYVCLQAHTAWAGAGWSPDAPSVLNVLWRRQ
ncbi:MAG: chitin-binding protein [Comamonadaceae bacterium]|nr:MAG: chitin-binding protein [Comamonadaceae bacterium]